MAKATVWYRGLSDIRSISKAHLKKYHNIDVENDLVWDASNLFKQEVELTPELEEVLRAQGTFKIEVDDGEVLTDPPVTDDTVESDKIVDTTTGQTTKPQKR